jgi:hypothetical protein
VSTPKTSAFQAHGAKNKKEKGYIESERERERERERENEIVIDRTHVIKQIYTIHEMPRCVGVETELTSNLGAVNRYACSY